MVCFYLHHAGHFTCPYNLHAAPSQRMGFLLKRRYDVSHAAHPNSAFDCLGNSVAAVDREQELMKGQLGHQEVDRMCNLATFWVSAWLQWSSSILLSRFNFAAELFSPVSLCFLSNIISLKCCRYSCHALE